MESRWQKCFQKLNPGENIDSATDLTIGLSPFALVGAGLALDSVKLKTGLRLVCLIILSFLVHIPLFLIGFYLLHGSWQFILVISIKKNPSEQ